MLTVLFLQFLALSRVFSYNLTGIYTFEGYGPVQVANNTYTCNKPHRECITKCLYNASCSAIAFDKRDNTCSISFLVFYARVILQHAQTFVTYVRGLYCLSEKYASIKILNLVVKLSYLHIRKYF